MTAAIRAPQPALHPTDLHPTDLDPNRRRPTVRLVDPAWFPTPPAAEPPPLRLIPGGHEAARRRRRSAAVYRRRRWAAAILAVALVFALLAGARTLERWVLEGPAAGATATATSGSTDAAGEPATDGPVGAPATPNAAVADASHVVQPGDTVWSIARRLQPEGDVRPLVDELVERSGGGALQAGERLDLTGLAP